MPERPQRNIGLELVRATEAAATVAAQHNDRGDRARANDAAAQALRTILSSLDLEGVIVAGEGEPPQATALYHGEKVGNGQAPLLDIAVDPIEGIPERALTRGDTLSLCAAAERGSMWDPGPAKFLQLIATGAAARDVIDLSESPRTNLSRIAGALKCGIKDLNVFVMDLPRHEQLIRDIRAAGARVKLHQGGLVTGAVLAAMPGTDVDVMMSTTLASDIVLAAAAVKTLGGGVHVRRAPQSDDEAAAIRAVGARVDEILDLNHLIASQDVFFAATGITDGSLLRGVRFGHDGVQTESLVLRAKTGSVRFMRTNVQASKVARISAIDYDGSGG